MGKGWAKGKKKGKGAEKHSSKEIESKGALMLKTFLK